MLGDALQRQVVTARKNKHGLSRFGKNDLLQEQRVCPGTVEFFGHLVRFADLTDLDETRRLKGQDVVADPGRRLIEGPGKLREGGRGRHEQTKDLHAAGVCQELDAFQ